MLTLSLFNLKNNEDIYISEKQAKKQIIENFFEFFVYDKKVDSKGMMIFLTLFFLLFSS